MNIIGQLLNAGWKALPIWHQFMGCVVALQFGPTVIDIDVFVAKLTILWKAKFSLESKL